MKSLILSFKLFFCLSLLMQGEIYSQCAPDPIYTKSGVYPAVIPHAIAGQLYVQIMTFVIPVDTTVLVSGMNIPVTIDSVGIDSIKGLPSGFEFSTNSPSNFWHGGTSGCMKLEGSSDKAGVFKIVFYLRGHTPITFPPYTTSDGFVLYQYPYDMHIDDISSFKILKSGPNPCYKGIINVTYISPSKNIEVCLYNYLGNILLKETITNEIGYNDYQIDLVKLLGHVSNGLYFYSMDDGFEKVTRKLVINMIP